MKQLLIGILLLAACTHLAAQQVTSPNGRLAANICIRDNQVAYDVTLDGEPLLTDARAAMNIGQDNRPLALKPGRHEARREHIEAFAYRQKAFDTQWNAQKFRLSKALSIEFRAYDDGIAYRFIQTARQPLTVDDEVALFRPAGDPKTHLAYTTNERQPEAMAFQNIYTAGTLSELPDRWAFMPVTMDFGRAKLTVLEADLEAYPGMFLRPVDGTLRSALARYPRSMVRGPHRGMTHVDGREEFIAQTTGARTFPWRVLCVTTDDRQMPVSNLVYALAAENRIGDTSWIRPGKSAWDWWHAWNLKGVPFRTGINMETYKYYIDFAARFGLDYAILDEGWYDSPAGDIMHPVPGMDLEELVHYADERGVGIILWAVFNVLDEHLEEACTKYAAMGIKGFKVDFLDRDDQNAVEMAYRIAQVCASHHLVLDYHGFYKPTGLNRTYPNVLNIESVFGMEEVKWNADRKDMPLYDVTFPFIRMMAGGVDYTPGAMRNATRKDFRDVYDLPMSMGTRCHQLASYVVHDSPLTMLADAATSYEAEPEYTRFLASIPNVVDETRILDARMGEYIVTARRAGSVWWIGGQTNWDERDIALDLHTLLGLEGNRQATLYADGPNADRQAEDYAVSRPTLEAGKPLSIHLASGGGFVLKVD